MSMQMEVGGSNTAPGLQEFPESKNPGRRTAKQFVQVTAPVAVPASNKPPVNIEKTVTELERIRLAFNKKLRFMVDHKDHDVIVKVIDPETDKVIRELPPKELERLRDHIREAVGILFDVQI